MESGYENYYIGMDCNFKGENKSWMDESLYYNGNREDYFRYEMIYFDTMSFGNLTVEQHYEYAKLTLDSERTCENAKLFAKNGIDHYRNEAYRNEIYRNSEKSVTLDISVKFYFGKISFETKIDVNDTRYCGHKIAYNPLTKYDEKELLKDIKKTLKKFTSYKFELFEIYNPFDITTRRNSLEELKADKDEYERVMGLAKGVEDKVKNAVYGYLDELVAKGVDGFVDGFTHRGKRIDPKYAVDIMNHITKRDTNEYKPRSYRRW